MLRILLFDDVGSVQKYNWVVHPPMVASNRALCKKKTVFPMYSVSTE